MACGSPDGDGANTIDGVTDDEHRIFVSSGSYTGNMGGVDAADANCQSLAESAGLSRTYKAILSTSSSNATDSDRISLVGAIYIINQNGDKTLIAASREDFWGTTNSIELIENVDVDEQLAQVSGARVWTGTGSDGATVPAEHCNGWTSTAGTGFYGLTNQANSEWIESNSDNCSNTNRIYCISQQE